MEERCQPILKGRGGPIATINIQANNFGLKNDMIQQVQNCCHFHGQPGDDVNKHLDKFLHVTQSIKVNGITDDALRLYLFPHSLTHHATAWFDRLTRNSITTFDQMASKFLSKYFPPSMVTKLRNEITNFRQLPDESLFEAWECYKLAIDRCPNHNMLPVTQIDTFYNGLTLRHHDTINVAAGDVLLDDFTLMPTPKSNSDVTSPRSNNLSTSNHVSLDSRHWSPSSGDLRSGLCLYVIALKYGIAYTMCTHVLFVYLKNVREVIGIKDREVTRYKAKLEDRARREEELFTRAPLSSVESKKLKHMRKLRFWGGPISPIAIQGMNFGLKNDMIQQVQNSCQFHGLPGDDANKHLDKFLHVTQSIKVNGVTDDALYLYIFPHFLTHHSTAWFDRLLRNSINTFEQMAKMFLEKYFPPSVVTKLRNEITNIRQRLDESLFEAWECYKLSIDRCPNRNMFPVTQIDTFYNGLTLGHRDTINAAAGGTFMKRRPEECYDLIENMTAHHNDWDISA
nr:reverse transcriptase domain-containing protein [Tanacetum cinerariifolium]